MGIDTTGTADAGTENVERPPAADQPPPPPPDQPGAAGTPSRAESRAAAQDNAQPQADKPREEKPSSAPSEVDGEARDNPGTKPGGSATGEQAEEASREATGLDEPYVGVSGERQSTAADSPTARDSTDEVTDGESREAVDSSTGSPPEVAVRPDTSAAIQQPDTEMPQPDADDQAEGNATPLVQAERDSMPAMDGVAESASGEQLDDALEVAAVNSGAGESDGSTETPGGQRPDTPGAGGHEAPTDHAGLQDADADGYADQRLARAISGEGLPDDNARVADLDEDAVERGLSDRFKQVVAKLDRSDQPQELNGTVDRPDFQDPQEDPRFVPDRYGTPLDRADGTRTPLFDGDPTREQTRQGDLGDCGIIATLGAVAGHRPDAIRDCVRETGDGNYQVRLHEAKFSTSRMRYEPTGRPITLTVTPELPVYDSEPGKPAFADSTTTKAAWAPVLEKAIAGTDQTWDDERRQKADRIWNAQGNTGDAPTGYVRLNQGSNPSDRAELLTQLTGLPARTVEFPTEYDHQGRSADKQLVDEFRQQLADHKPVLVGTRARHEGELRLPNKLSPSHAYEVAKVDDQGRIHLRNPWNVKHPDPMTINEFKANIRPRYSTLESP